MTLNLDQYKAVTQKYAAPHTSDRYSFIPTTRVLRVFEALGWFPASASEARTRSEAKQGYQRHMLRLRNSQFDRSTINVGDAFPEIVVVNSHDGGAAFQLYAALMEKICSNGLVVQMGKAGEHYRIPHVGYTADRVFEAVRGITDVLPRAFARRSELQGIRLTFDQQLTYAGEAARLRFERRHEVNLLELLHQRHAGQGEPTLWNVFQRAQEAVIRGGVPLQQANGRFIRSRAVTSITENVRLNRALWELTERTASLVQ